MKCTYEAHGNIGTNGLAAIGTPARIATAGHVCSGLYCRPCLEIHFDNGNCNTCPLHKTTALFEVPPPPRKPVFVSGARVTTYTLDQIKDRDEATEFLTQLWLGTKSFCDDEHIFESDIEYHIMKTSDLMNVRWGYETNVTVKKEHWAAVKDIAKDMTKMHFENEDKLARCESMLSSPWKKFLGPLEQALGKKF
jgi:hypothetical protein